MIDRKRLASWCYRLAWHAARVYWFVARPRMRGVKCVITRGDEVLFIRHTYGDRGAWELPGGSIKRGEAPLAAARRETFEEVGLSISDWVPLGDFFAKHEYREDNLYCFRAVVDDAVPKPDGIEIAEAAWFPSAAPPDPTGPFVRRILSMSQSGTAAAAPAA